MHSKYRELGLVGRANPVYQNRSLDSEEGHMQPYSHNKVVEENLLRGSIKPE
jgi:hypothetical protein